jgi:6-phosphogluconate dehydrogenase
MSQQFAFGMIGLGVMGQNFALNLLDNGVAVLGYDKDLSKGEGFVRAAQGKPAGSAVDLADFVARLEKPRVVMMLVAPASVADIVLKDLLPLLEPNDLVIDGGNSFFKDTDRRGALCAEKGVHFFGMGVSGGESGARHGPSMMPGGPKEGYQRVQPMLEAIAAKVNGEPCVGWVGEKSAGHYVKMVHNGIEYGLMQLIAEVYDILHRGGGVKHSELHDIFETWNKGELASYLVEITAKIFAQKDEHTSGDLLDKIKDAARQKGTGKWTSQDALDLTVPTSIIDMAVFARNISGMTDERTAVSKQIGEPIAVYAGERDVLVKHAKHGLRLASLLSYAQGVDLLRHASKAYGYGVDLEQVAKIWRGGCIIRAALLEDIRAAYKANPALVNLVVDEKIAAVVKECLPSLRWLLRNAIDMGIPTPCHSAALNYIESLRCGRLPTNLTQAQRDYFGAHTYERIDREGTFHTQWEA